MSVVRALVVLVVVWLSAVPARAEVDARQAEQLMRQSGVWQQLASVAPQVQAGFMAQAAQGGSGLSARELERARQVINDTFAPERLRAVGLAVVAKGLDPADVAALARWYASPTGQRITALEEAAATTQTDPRSVLQDGGTLLAQLPAARRQLMAQLVETTRAAQFMTQLTINTALAAHKGMASVPGAQTGPSAEQLLAALEGQRPALLQNLTTFAMASFALAYAPLSSQELTAYISFLGTGAGRQFNDLGAQAFDAAMVDGTAEMARRLPGTKDQANT